MTPAEEQDVCAACGLPRPTKVSGEKCYCVDCYPKAAGE